MRRIALYLIIFAGFHLNLSARDLTFRGESLATALAALRELDTEYTINFIANDLEQLPVHASVNGLSMTDAIKVLCKGQPVKAKIKGKQIFIQYDTHYKARTIILKGSVYDARTREQLIGAKVELLDEDSTLIDTTSARRRFFYYGSLQAEQEFFTSQFSFEVPALPRHYIFRVSFDDYRTVCLHYVLDRVGRRETSRSVSPFYLHKESKTLQEVTVTASRVRFYYKGDTIVYNADEFKLAEGSMLDALLKQLPGVELKSDGRIYHNGKFVDDLLLNGKDFFQGDKKLMLGNLPAYTVKHVAIYNKQSEENEWLGRTDESTQHYVIDVRLKKEYMAGWIANVEAGTGIRQDETPYLARLFAMRNTERSQIGIIAKANNLNDENTYDLQCQEGWSPSTGNSLRRNELARVIVGVDNDDKTKKYYGYVDVRHSTERQEQHQTTQTFLPNGDTYDYSFSKARDEDWDASTYHKFTYSGKQVMLNSFVNADYYHFCKTSGSTSGLFSAPVDVSRQLLDDLFSPTSPRPNLRDTLINRQLRESLGTGHDFEMNARLYGTSKVKGSNDVLNYGLDGSYKENARQQFSRQSTETPSNSPLNGEDSSPLREGWGRNGSLFRHQFSDTPPRSKFEIAPFVSYTLSLGEGYRKLFVGYRFYHRNLREQESIYRLDRLQGADSSFAHPIDLLPSESEYQQVFDRTNSSLSHYIENHHSPWAFLQQTLQQGEWGQLCLDVNLSGELRHQRNDYERGSIDTVLYRFAPTFDFSVKPWLRTKDSHHAGLEVGIGNNAPDLLNEAAVVDDTDPMNIRIGNPDLHYSLYMKTTLDGNLYSFNKRMHNRLDLHYGFTHNAIGMGQTYDRQTGIRTYRPTNVNGNWDAFARHTINYSFGDGKKHNARMITQFSYRNSVDLLYNEELRMKNEESLSETTAAANSSFFTLHSSLRSIVRTATLSFEPSMSLSLGKHTLNFSSDIAWNRYTSDRVSFQDISAWQYRIGADAIVHLPWEFDLTTNLTLYGRTGYADSSLNTNDVVWNARLARPLFKGKWLVMLDGFDILGQLSNVTRTINAQGRTETFTNVLPRYALLHVIYKFSKQPKQTR